MLFEKNMKKLILTLLSILTTTFCLCQETTTVFDIARKGTLEQMKEMVKKNPKAVNSINKDGFSPLTLACYRENNEVAKFLIDKGSNINQKSSMGTPLMAAVVKGNREMVTILLNNKADINETDENGVTALIYAVQFRNIEAVKALLQNKADKTKIDKQGKTAFEYAVFSGNEEIINVLK